MGGTTTATEKKVLSQKSIAVVIALSIGYLLLSYLLLGFKIDQLVLVGLANLLYFLSPVTRKLVLGFSIFIIYWVLYDYMKAFPNYWFNTVHIQDLYLAEKAVFGITVNESIVVHSEFWYQNSRMYLDVITGFFYLMWVPVPLAFAVFLFFRDRRQFAHFSFTFLLVNLLGFVVYYLYPAAPPWYVQQHGFTFEPGTPGHAAGLLRFDAFFNINLFSSIYKKGSNVFAAMPSLHASYPLIVLYYALRNNLGWLAYLLFGIVAIGIWFAAVYTAHHYVLDVLAGIVCAWLGILLFNWLLTFSLILKAVSRFIQAIK